LGVRALEVENHRDALLVLVGDLLRVVEAARQHEVHLDAVRVGSRLDPSDALRRLTDARLALADGRGTRRRRGRFRLRPVVEVLPAPTRRAAPDVRPLAGALLEALLGGVPVLVVPVVLLLGDAEVDEGPVPEVS